MGCVVLWALCWYPLNPTAELEDDDVDALCDGYRSGIRIAGKPAFILFVKGARRCKCRPAVWPLVPGPLAVLLLLVPGCTTAEASSVYVYSCGGAIPGARWCAAKPLWGFGELVVAVLLVYGIEAVEEDEGEVCDGGFISLSWKDVQRKDEGQGAEEEGGVRTQCSDDEGRVDR
jgi:hypothetical protein